VAREDHGHARCREAGQHPAQHIDAHGIEAGERLVEHEQLRPVHERGGELHALLVAQGELFDGVAGTIRDAEPLEPAVRSGLPPPEVSPWSRAKCTSWLRTRILG
jgi:hypothetical protein